MSVTVKVAVCCSEEHAVKITIGDKVTKLYQHLFLDDGEEGEYVVSGDMEITVNEYFKLPPEGTIIKNTQR